MDDDLRKPMAEVPKAYADRFTVLVGLTDAFCGAHLNAEYKHLCRKMAETLCQDGSPVTRGEPEGWAAGSLDPLTRLAAQLQQARAEIALLREELRIKDARMAEIAAHRRPQYTPTERMAILELKAVRGWN